MVVHGQFHFLGEVGGFVVFKSKVGHEKLHFGKDLWYSNPRQNLP